MSLSSAKAKLDAQPGDPATGYISKQDHKDSYDELVADTALTGATTAAGITVSGAVQVGATAGLVVGASGPKVLSGSGSPEGAVTAPVGSIYLRTDGGADTAAYYKTSGTGNTGWTAADTGTGDVVGPASATDNALTRFDGTTGKLVQNSGLIVDDSNNVTGMGTLNGVAASQLRSTLPVPLNNYWSNGAYVSANTVTSTIGRCIFWIINPGFAHTIQSLSIYVSGAAGAGATYRLGFWEVNSSGQPGTLIADAGTLDPTTTGKKTISSLSVALTADLTFMGLALQGTGTGAGNIWTTQRTAMTVSSNPTLDSAQPVIYANGITGALASNPTIATNGGWAAGYNVPLVDFRRSAA